MISAHEYKTLTERLDALESENTRLKTQVLKDRIRQPGTTRTDKTMLYIYKGNGPVLNTPAILKLLGLTERGVITTSWEQGCVEIAVNQSLLRAGRKPEKAMTQEQWLAGHPEEQGELNV